MIFGLLLLAISRTRNDDVTFCFYVTSRESSRNFANFNRAIQSRSYLTPFPCHARGKEVKKSATINHKRTFFMRTTL